MAYIYGLQLVNEKYYVGRTDNVENRYKQHLKGEGAIWTKIHKPIKIILITLSTSPLDEDKYTKEFMIKYGIDNVRGGSYVTVELDLPTKEFLQKEFWGSLNFCVNCGQAGHFINSCPIGREIIDKEVVKFDQPIVISTNTAQPITIPNNYKELNNSVQPITIPNNYKELNNNIQPVIIPANVGKINQVNKQNNIEACKRCNRFGHSKKDCHAKTKLDGKEIQIKKCSRCKRPGHNKTKCHAKTDVNGKVI